MEDSTVPPPFNPELTNLKHNESGNTGDREENDKHHLSLGYYNYYGSIQQQLKQSQKYNNNNKFTFTSNTKSTSNENRDNNDNSECISDNNRAKEQFQILPLKENKNNHNDQHLIDNLPNSQEYYYQQYKYHQTTIIMTMTVLMQ